MTIAPPARLPPPLKKVKIHLLSRWLLHRQWPIKSHVLADIHTLALLGHGRPASYQPDSSYDGCRALLRLEGCQWLCEKRLASHSKCRFVALPGKVFTWRGIIHLRWPWLWRLSRSMRTAAWCLHSGLRVVIFKLDLPVYSQNKF